MEHPAEDLNRSPESGPRPRDLALLLLAAGCGPPRARARDQQADRAGGALLVRVLDRLAALDPGPDQVEEALAAVVAEFGEPSGPTRAACAQIRREWEDARSIPGFWAWLLTEALEASGRGLDGDRARRHDRESSDGPA
jgi:hypothetical protein